MSTVKVAAIALVTSVIAIAVVFNVAALRNSLAGGAGKAA